MASIKGHKSWFSYPISKPFPFRWFSPGAIVGGIICTAIFTFLNFASSGYNLVIQTSSNPNLTISHGNWLQHWPSYLTAKVQPTCQPVNIPVNNQFFTNQTALTYTLTSVWQEANGSQVISPSLTYFNNPLEACSVASVEINLAALDRAANQFAYCEWGSVVRSYVSCQIVTDAGTTFLNLTQIYEYIPDTVTFSRIDTFLGSEFLSRDQTRRASLWWGESLMSNFWGQLIWLMQNKSTNQTQHRKPAIRKGTISFTPNGSYSDIKDLRFFNADYRFIVDLGLGAHDVVCCPELQTPLSAGSLNAASLYPNIWTEADTLAKSTYSTVLTDLGQAASVPNMLTDASLLTYFTSNITEATMANIKAGPANSPFNVTGISTGALGTTPSVISATYICQVPELKSAGNLIIAILVADLVLLQVVWKLYTLLAQALVAKRQSSKEEYQSLVEGNELQAISHPDLSPTPRNEGRP